MMLGDQPAQRSNQRRMLDDVPLVAGLGRMVVGVNGWYVQEFSMR